MQRCAARDVQSSLTSVILDKLYSVYSEIPAADNHFTSTKKCVYFVSTQDTDCPIRNAWCKIYLYFQS